MIDFVVISSLYLTHFNVTMTLAAKHCYFLVDHIVFPTKGSFLFEDQMKDNTKARAVECRWESWGTWGLVYYQLAVRREKGGSVYSCEFS